uniref:Uncharacterized protein n=1 Tax=Peronospora matthiolae TaxID=2874970 RepID=A0AAV1V4P4_9STRA
MRDKLEDAEQKVAEFQDELDDREERLEEITILKSALLKLKTARHAEQEKHRRQLAALSDKLDLVIASSQDANAQAKLQIEDAQAHFSARQSTIMRELAMAQRDRGAIKVERDRFAVRISGLMVQRDRLNRNLADRDVDCSQLVKKLDDLKAERDQALQSKYFLFTRMAELNCSLRRKRSPPASKSEKPKTKRYRRAKSSPGKSMLSEPSVSRPLSSEQSEASDSAESPPRSASPNPFGSRSLSSEGSEFVDHNKSSSAETVIHFWRRYRHLTLPSDVELRSLSGNRRRSTSMFPVQNPNLLIPPSEYP